MKKTIFATTLILAVIGSISTAQAQNNVVKINILSPIVRTISVFYENAIQEDKSFQLGFFYTGASVTDTKFRGFGITPEFRFYLSETSAPEGVYVAPFLKYQNFDLTEEITDSKATLSTFGGGVVIGKQWLFKEKITLDAFLGPNFNSGDVKVESGNASFSTGAFEGFGLRLGLTFGLAF
ncbi:DUF3575 domain-containing protein [Fulvivirgaceae bacterium BMA10]|uniref:DUF3575 domain-containing protein n=1 Tax=Splendidivirga corallicola TaxID=3051826 RepID=A0ABT8KQU8_9BACT|nr:DUF3575 domain-containing protein [Fulvivirgaceae bacterium BMA10]